MRLLAVDPGPTTSGWCLIDSSLGARVRFIEGGRTHSAPEALEELMRDAEAVAVETPKGYVFQPARGAQLLATARIAGVVGCLAHMRGLRLVELSAQEWRKALCGCGTAGDGLVADVVSSNVAGLPERTNAHVRDACGLALVAGWVLHGSMGARVAGSTKRLRPRRAVGA